MTLSVRSRFEVFKRDAFTCRYCGQTPDTEGVKLEVDHITPRSAGGSDEITNLVTSCWACNSGKSDKSLDDKAPSLTVAMANTRERALQLDEYRKWQASLDDVSSNLVARVWDEWVEAFAGDKVRDDSTGMTTWSVPSIGVPSKQAIMRYIDDGAEVATILTAIEKTRRRWLIGGGHLPDLGDADVQRYFFGTLKRMLEDTQAITAGSESCDGACGYQEGKNAGAWLENQRIRELLLNHAANGFQTYSDVIAALWPEDQ